MKKIFFLACLLLSVLMTFAQTKKVAILEVVDRQDNIPYANKLILRSNLAKAITSTKGYEAYDRTDIDAIMSEHDFQRTGLVSEDQIKQLGIMTGADYVLVPEAVLLDEKTMYITAKLLNVETAKTEITDNQMMGIEPLELKKGCELLASKLFKSNKGTTDNLLKSHSGNPIFLGFGGSFNMAYFEDNTDFSLGGGIGMDYAHPITNKFAMGFFINGALYGSVNTNNNEGIPYQLNLGLLMLAGDLKDRPFIIGVTPFTGFSYLGGGRGMGYFPVGVRLGRKINKHMYIIGNFTLGLAALTKYDSYTYSASLTIGYGL